MTVKDLLAKLDMDVNRYYIYKDDSIENRLYDNEEAILFYGKSKVKSFWITNEDLNNCIDIFITLEEEQ